MIRARRRGGVFFLSSLWWSVKSLTNASPRLWNVWIKEKPRIARGVAIGEAPLSCAPWKQETSLLSFCLPADLPVMQVIYGSLCFLCSVKNKGNGREIASLRGSTCTKSDVGKGRMLVHGYYFL